MPKLQAINLTKRYGTVEVVHGVNFDIQDGEFIVLVGESGCGKSTILRMIAGLEDISDGQLRVDDDLINDLEPRDRGIAMVFQDYALYPHMSVAENIAFSLEVSGVNKEERQRRVAEVAEILQITPLLERKPRALSGGQRQRVAMGRALIRDPDFFLFDEPLSNLDAKLRGTMRAEIKRLHRRLNATIVYVTHDQVEAMTLADRIICLNGGVIAQMGTPEDLYNQPIDLFVAQFIGSPQMNFLPAVAEVDGTAVSLRLETGLTLPVPSEQAQRLTQRARKKLVIGIRPEHLSIGSGGQLCAISGKVEMVEPLGSDTLVHIRLGETLLIGRVPPGSVAKDATDAELEIDLTKLHVFDAETGLRV